MVRVLQYIVQVVLLCGVFTPIATAQSTGEHSTPNQSIVDRQAASESFDVNAVVGAYLAEIPPAMRARSNANFEGVYWFLLWDFHSTVVANVDLAEILLVNAHA
jgi:STE24 endopeptidase